MADDAPTAEAPGPAEPSANPPAAAAETQAPAAVAAKDDGPRPDAAASKAVKHPLLERDLAAQPAPLEEDAREEQERAWRDADAPETSWGSSERFDHPEGRQPSGLDVYLDSWRTEICGWTAIVVTGHVDAETRWVAEHLATSGDPKEVRRATYRNSVRRSFPGLLRDVSAAPKRRLVANCWALADADALSQSLGRLREAIACHVGEPCQIVFWTRPSVARALERDGRTWPENVKHIAVDAVLAQPASPVESLQYDLAHYRGLFGSGLSSLRDVLRAQEHVIERALVRVVSLYGPLPSGEVDAIMHAVLGDTTIHIDGQDADDARDVLARELWTNGKDLFLRRSGLARSTKLGPQVLEFVTTAPAEAAASAAWEDPEAMLDVCMAAAAVGPIFGADAELHRREFFEGHLGAMSTLARRAPRSFAGRWLDGVRQDYVRWARSKFPDVSLADGSLAGILAALRSERLRTKRAMWQHFVRRVGYLCRSLLDGSADVVEHLLEELFAARAVHVVWLILVELRDWPYPSYQRWISRLLTESGDGRAAMIDLVARDIAYHPELGIETLQQLSSALCDGDANSATPLQNAATEVAFLLIDETYQSSISGRPTPLALARLLEMKNGGPSFRSYFEACMLWVARKIDPHDAVFGEGPAYRIAIAWLQMLIAAPEIDRPVILAVASSVKRGLKADPRGAVLDELRSIEAWFAEKKDLVPFNDGGRVERQQLMERVNLCKTLIRA